MANWIPFAEGEYLVEKAFIVAPDNTAVAVEGAVIEVYLDKQSQRQLKGRGRIRNILLVELLEDNDDLDLVLDLGDEFKYRITKPDLQAGKVFSPDVKSSVQFTPTAPWEQIPAADFAKLVSRLKVLRV
jgi:hypothetical protein